MATNVSKIDTDAPTWDQLAAIAERHGPSFFLANPARFEHNTRRFLRAFRSLYPRTSVGYSYKTNYLPEFILRADALGAYSEVVSRFEFELAQELGVPADRIIFNGPIKGPDDLLRAMRAGALVNADSIPEIWEMVRIADRLKAPVAVGVRCNLRSQNPGSRFGIDIEAPDAADALGAIDASKHVRLAGLHFHYSGERSADHYRHRTRAMIDLHREVLGSRPLDFIDMGGGFAGAMSPELASQLNSSSATYEEYAEAIAGELYSAYGEHGPELILEPGMALVADAMTFVSRVETVKAQHRSLAVLDGSRLNVQPPWNLLRQNINPPVRVVAAPGSAGRGTGRWDLVGHTCIERDILHEGYEGSIGIGDYVQFDNVGAYTNVLHAPFIRGTPPIVVIDAAGSATLVRPRSTAKDLLGSYTAPGDAR